MNGDYATCMQDGGRAAVEGRWQEAESLLREAARLEPKSADAHRSLAAVLHMSNQLDAAIDMWRTAIELEPSSSTSHFNLGLIYLGQQNFEKAKHSFSEALRLKPGLADAAFNLGRIAYHEDDRSKARTYFENAVRAQPSHGKAHASLIQMLTELGLEKEAISAGNQAIQALRGTWTDPPKGYVEILMHVANAYRRIEDLGSAAMWYREAVALDPDNYIAKHLLAAAEGVLTEEHTKEYTTRSFDIFAGSFEDHLLNVLGYQSPDILTEHLHNLKPDTHAFPSVLDLGCGTGLMGVSLAKHFEVKNIVGIDLSQNMLEQAESKSLYHQLIKGDIEPVMEGFEANFDLIVAADVFIYIGKVSGIFKQAFQRLNPQGVFAFTVEDSQSGDVALAPTGRYQHSRSYVRNLARDYGFKVVHEAEGMLRKDARNDIRGRYFYLQQE